LSYHH